MLGSLIPDPAILLLLTIASRGDRRGSVGGRWSGEAAIVLGWRGEERGSVEGRSSSSGRFEGIERLPTPDQQGEERGSVDGRSQAGEPNHEPKHELWVPPCTPPECRGDALVSPLSTCSLVLAPTGGGSMGMIGGGGGIIIDAVA